MTKNERVIGYGLVLLIVLAASTAAQSPPTPAARPVANSGSLGQSGEPGPVPPPLGGPGQDPMAALAQPKRFSAARASSFERGGGNLDTVRIPAGGQEVTLAELRGPGALTHMWTTFRGLGRDLILRIYWEGRDTPSVEAPIGDFFGVAMGIDANINSFPLQVSGGGKARNCYWYMPFNKAARVTASNTREVRSGQNRDISLYYYIDYQVFGAPIKDIMYFHARFRETDPTERGKPVTLVEAEGDGHFVGVVLGHRARTPGWFGEGDDIITVDGKVAFLGTGTEDYFNDAWGFRVFSELYHGVPVYEGRKVGDRLSAYRFHLMDPIPFRHSFKFEIEHWPWAAASANIGREYYSSLGFWYQTTPHKPWPRLTQLLSSDPWDPTKGRWHVQDSLEAEDLGLVEWRSKSSEPTAAIPEIKADTESAEVLRGMLRYGPKPRPVFYMPFLSGDHMLGFDSGGDGEFTLAVPASEAGTYSVSLNYARSDDYGIVQLYVNGEAVGSPTDTYLRMDRLTRPLFEPKDFAFAGVRLKEGLNTFRFVINSKNSESDGYRLGLDSIVLRKATGTD